MFEERDHPGVRRASRMMLVVCVFMFTLHALGKGVPLTGDSFMLVLACLIASIGLSFRWSRWMPDLLHDPGEHLALESKVVGWAAFAVIPWIVDQRLWIWLPIAMAAPVVAMALWMRRRWAYAPCMLLAAAVGLVGLWLIARALAPVARGGSCDVKGLVHGIKVALEGAAIAIPVQRWRAGLSSPPRYRIH